jgi:hypothetical protein
MSIAKLPAPSSPPAELPSETVVLYPDAAWTGESFTITTKKFASNQRHSISGSHMQDKATWLAFNLPPGVVMTLVDHYVSAGSNGLADLKDAGRVVDLIGTGKTQAVDLTRCNMNDCISAFFWREVDLGLGAIELYEDTDFKGNRTLLFPAEWSVGKAISLAGWHINDKLSSCRWHTLKDTQSAELFDKADGSGKSYANISGYGETKEITNFKDVGFNDCASAFKFKSLAPRKEEIEKFELALTNAEIENDTICSELSGTNYSSEKATQTLTINQTEAETLTVTVANAHTAGTKMGVSFAVQVGKPGVLAVTTTVSVELSYSYTHTDTTSRSATKSQSLTVSQTFPAPPHSTYWGKLIASMGKLPATQFRTKAKRWYKEQLPGTVQDPANNKWYVRTEEITGTVQGRLCCKTYLENDSKKIVPAAAK